ncbi:MAG TPA: APC family permease [Flavobacteriaceae bacterium]|nr:APC family permease [Flavobacteriaceae bacterium]
MKFSLTDKDGKLKELAATSISGNDISSSCLYVSALAIAAAGQYAWISLLIVAAVLFMFRKIYGEVVGALPMNGGAYNALLNTTSKRVASMAACLTILSYMATAVISAGEAMHYVHSLVEGFPVFFATLGLLLVFMFLNIAGISESAKVATGIFIFHLFSLVLLSLVCGWYLINHGWDELIRNFQRPIEHGSLLVALFIGFAVSMLGTSGFESSANYVEEQAKGVFPKTLRNMWIVVSVFNPLMAFLTLSIMPIPEVELHANALLSHLGAEAGGPWLMWLISIDAAIVLSGAVLTSYVGVSGLVKRMTLDRCLPQFLLKENKKGVNYPIMIGFFLLCGSILLITQGNIEALAGVYLISFLAVMLLFAVGNILLKINRDKLPRPEKAGPLALFIAIVAVVAALIGNILIKPEYFGVFLSYFIPTVVIVMGMLLRVPILRGVLGLLKNYIDIPFEKKLDQWLKRKIVKINSQKFIFFTRGDNVANLNMVLNYIKENEHTNKILLVSVVGNENEIPERLKSDIEVLDRAYPQIDVDFVIKKGKFSPELIEKLSVEYDIPKNFMFIGAPGDEFPYRIEHMGVRIII